MGIATSLVDVMLGCWSNWGTLQHGQSLGTSLSPPEDRGRCGWKSKAALGTAGTVVQRCWAGGRSCQVRGRRAGMVPVDVAPSQEWPRGGLGDPQRPCWGCYGQA